LKPKDKAMAFEEADIVINGVRLDSRQSATLRVAVTFFHNDNTDPDRLGKDTYGRFMTKQYREDSAEILTLILGAKVI
jgi:hypothetical protein